MSNNNNSKTSFLTSPLFGGGRRRQQVVKQRTPATTTTAPPAAPLAVSSGSADNISEPSDNNNETTSWRDRLLKLSNWASILCVIDCTVLPIVTVLLPLLGLVAFSPAQMEFLHEVGHQIAMYFVIPVGGTAALMNYASHKRKLLSLPAALGLLLIYAANASHHGSPSLLARLLPHDVVHALHCGTWLHRTTNVVGCGLLLSSNYYSHQATHKHGGADGEQCCSHHHH